tara:strand:- start:430 stop:600 length:171 start_codon:yes stop_codon:yes gene_type:complete
MDYVNRTKKGLIAQDSSSEKVNVHSQFSESGVFVREDDQDWGSSGMNDIEQKSDLK